MKFALIIFISSLMFVSCSESNASDGAKESKDISENEHVELIETKFNQIKGMSIKTEKEQEAVSNEKSTLIKMMDDFTKKFPKNSKTPEYLDKMHMIYSSMNNYELSSKYADKLITDYPNYINRKMIIESQITNYRFIFKPIDSSKVASYMKIIIDEKLEKDSLINIENIEVYTEFAK